MFKKILTALFITLCTAGMAAAEAAVGEPAPAFTATDTQGNTHKLKDFKGKTVVLEWHNPECPYVVKHYESNNMQMLQKKYIDQGVIWLTINSNADGKQGSLNGEQADAYIEKMNAAPTAYLIDKSGTIGKAYGARTTPHMFVINKEGTLVYAGAIDDNSSSRQSVIKDSTNYVAEALNSLKNEESIATASSEPYGCSVKYD